MGVVASETYTSTSAPIQYAAVSAFSGGTVIEHYLSQSRRILAFLGKYIFTALSEAGVLLAKPQGAFYLFPDFSAFKEGLNKRKIYTSRDLCNKLLKDTGVAILPGADFGRPEAELTARLAYVDFDGARALEACETIPPSQSLDEQFLETYMPNTIAAVDLLVSWLHNYIKS
jgi:aspartate aminotransferase